MKKLLLSTLWCAAAAVMSLGASADELVLSKEVPADGQPFAVFTTLKYSGQKNAVLSSTVTGGYFEVNILSTTLTTAPDNLTVNAADVTYLAFETSENSRYLKVASGTNNGKYIKCTSTNASFSFVENINDATQVDVSVNGTSGAGTVKFGNTGKYFRCNFTSATSARFANYSSSTGGAPYFYVADGPADANAKFENIVCKKGESKDIIYTPADLGTVSYDIPAEAGNIFTITDNTLTALKVGGPFTVTASWGETEKYKAGTATFTVTVEGNVSNPTFEPAEAEINVGTPVKLATADGAELYYAVLEGLDATVPEAQEFTAYPADGILLKAGEFTVAAYGELDGEKSSVVTHSYTVSKITPEFKFPEANCTAYISEGFTMPELTNVPEGFPVDKITYTSSNPDVASVEAATRAIELKTVGETEIHAIFAGDDTYSSADVYFTLKVEAEKPETAVFDFTGAGAAGEKNNYGMTINAPDYEKEVKSVTEDGVTCDFTGSYRIWHGNADAYTESGNHLRVQAGATFTFTAPAGKIIKRIDFTFTESNNGASNLVADPGTYTAGHVKAWVPDENVYTNAVKFTRTGDSGNTRICTITVTLSDAPVPAIPEILADGTAVAGDGYRAPVTAETVEISFGEVPAGVSIWYRFTEAAAAMAVAGEAEEAPFTKYKAAFTLDKPGTLEYYVQNDELGSKSDIKRLTISIPVGIDGIGADEADAEYYDLNGSRIAGAPEQGIYLRKAAGKVSKVIIR